MSSACIKLLAALFGGLGMIGLSSTALAQAEFAAQVGWDEGGKPSDVEFKSGSINTRPFKEKPNHYLGERRFASVHAQEDFVVRWPGLALTLRGRAQVAEAGSEPEFFRVAKPDTGMLCNDDPVAALFRQARRSDTESRLEVMLQIIVLLERRSTGCNDTNRRNLVNLLFKLNYDLAKESRFFDFSPDVLRIFRAEYGDTRAVNQRIDAYQAQVDGLAMKAAEDASIRALERGDFERFDQINGKLQDAAEEERYLGAFRAQRISMVNLRHREIQALYTQFEQRPRQLGTSGAPSIDEREAAATSYRAAERLADLGRDDAYSSAFANAALPRSTARQLPATARRSLDLVQVAPDAITLERETIEDRESTIEASEGVAETIGSEMEGAALEALSDGMGMPEAGPEG